MLAYSAYPGKETLLNEFAVDNDSIIWWIYIAVNLIVDYCA